MSTFVIPSGNLLNSLSLMFNTLLTRRGSLVVSVSTSVPRLNVKSSTFLCGNFLTSSTDLRRASCQLLVKDWALNIGKLFLGGLTRNSVVK